MSINEFMMMDKWGWMCKARFLLSGLGWSCLFIANFYMRREDVSTKAGLSALAFASHFTPIDQMTRKKKREKRSLNWDIIVAVTFFSSSSLFLFIIGFFSAQNFYWDRWISWKPSRFRRWNLVLLIFSRRVLIRIFWKTKIIRNSYKQTATAKNTKT